MKATFPILLVLCVLLSTLPSSRAGKVYKWIDEKGVIHFSDREPGDAQNRKGIIEERSIRESPPPAERHPSEALPRARSPIEHAVNCTFTIRGHNRIGTGFLIDANGYAATCKHVVEGGFHQMAVFNDQREFPIQLVATSERHDLALIQVLVPERLPHLPLGDPEAMLPGERLFAVGTSAGLQATVTDGVFTGIRKVASSQERLLQFSAPINPGNSGGPLLDEKGRAVGVVSLKYILRDGHAVTGVGFAVPSRYLSEEFGYFISSKAF